MWQLPLPRGENLATNIFKNHRPWLQVHHQHGLELSFGPLQLHLDKQIDCQIKKKKKWNGILIQTILSDSSPTSPALLDIWMNSLVMISTISRTCGRAYETLISIVNPRLNNTSLEPRSIRLVKHLSGVGAGVDTQQTTVLIAVVVWGSVVHPVMPAKRKIHTQKKKTVNKVAF